MKTVGVIAELNPIHKGHVYLFEQIRKETGADAIVLAMSGDFVQRGEPALMDKYTRTKLALLNGANAVFELPLVFATASAEYFAKAGVSLLAAAGVDLVCFGAEDPDFPFSKIAAILNEEPSSYQELLRGFLTEGDAYPKARMKALCSYLDEKDTSSPYRGQALQKALSSSNNILGIEYAKAALEAGLPIHPIQRIGNDHNDNSALGPVLSSSGLRELLKQGTYPEDPFYQYLKAYTDLNADGRCFVWADDLSDAFCVPILLRGEEGVFTDYFDCDEALSNRIAKHFAEFRNITDFAELLKAKNYTQSRIRRVLLHILLDIKTEDVYEAKYLRLLGFRKDASGLLFEINGKASEKGYTMISKPAKARQQLSAEQYALFRKDLSAADLYQYYSQSDTMKADITRSPIVISQ